MAKKAKPKVNGKSKIQVKNEVIKAMKELGTYSKEFDGTISIYAGMLHQYMYFEKEFEKLQYKIEEPYTNKAGATNMRKVPLFTAMESLRKDIATYSDKLGLNPKAMESITAEKANLSSLEKVLSGL